MSEYTHSPDDRFGQIVDRQMRTECEGEERRQARGDRRKGYGHKRSARKRMQGRMAR